jgi:hypothetical protein
LIDVSLALDRVLDPDDRIHEQHSIKGKARSHGRAKARNAEIKPVYGCESGAHDQTHYLNLQGMGKVEFSGGACGNAIEVIESEAQQIQYGESEQRFLHLTISGHCSISADGLTPISIGAI